MNRPSRISELTVLYSEFLRSHRGSLWRLYRLLPRAILELVPSVATVLAEDNYSHRLTRERWVLISEQLPDIAERFHSIVVRDCVDVLNRFGDPTYFTDNNWAARFGEEWEKREADPQVFSYLYRAKSFFNTSFGLRSYATLFATEVTELMEPLSPAPLSVILIADKALEDLHLHGISMSHILSFGARFLCARCENGEPMSWLKLLEHFKSQQEIFRRAYTNKLALGADIPIVDCHSENLSNPPARLITTQEAELLRAMRANLDHRSEGRCNLCMSLGVPMPLSTQDNLRIWTHHVSWHVSGVYTDIPGNS